MGVILSCGCEKPPTLKKTEITNCCMCKGSFCMSHIYYYVDGNNGRITKNGKPFCLKCYKIKYQ